jgi:hypothetical protein
MKIMLLKTGKGKREIQKDEYFLCRNNYFKISFSKTIHDYQIHWETVVNHIKKVSK